MPHISPVNTDLSLPQHLEVRRLLSQKDKLENSKIDAVAMTTDLQDDEVIVKIERFALTTNNITYAAFGDSMSYWQFFPTNDDAWGHMPVWGVSTVVASVVDDVPVGERYFGYYPMASHLKLKAGKSSPRGFVDTSTHRQELPAAYNYYTRYNEMGLESKTSDYQMLLRPLFLTSYMLADYLLENDFFKAGQVIISGASSKTAYGSAFCFSDHADTKLAGLTSSRNKAFVERLGCYQAVVTYDDLETIDSSVPTLYIDFSGDVDLRSRVHRHFGNNLVHDCYAGSASNLNFLEESTDNQSKTRFFFAAIHYRKRVEELGAKSVLKGMNDKQAAFVERVGNPKNPWLTLKFNNGLEAAGRVVRKLCLNEARADEGYIVALP